MDETSSNLSDEDLTAKLAAGRQERALARRRWIEERLAAREIADEEIHVGLKAFNGICDQWAIDTADAEAILGKNKSEGGSAELVEQISYTLRIYRLVNEVIQGDEIRHQRWIRRSNTALGGNRPIDLMRSGPEGSAKVMEYLEFCQLGHSS